MEALVWLRQVLASVPHGSLAGLMAACLLLAPCANMVDPAQADLPVIGDPHHAVLLRTDAAQLQDAPRRLRADFEPIDVLALVHMPDWESSIRTIIERVIDEVDVHVLAIDEGPESRRFHRWARRAGARVSYLDHDSPWIRDYGPFQVFENGAPVWMDFGYSDDRQLDDGVPIALARKHLAALDIELLSLDGGGVVSDGDGLCASTDYTLNDTGLDRADNHGLQALMARLGCRVMAVVPKLDDEETGHIDLAVQFLAPDVVAVAKMDPRSHPQQAAALETTALALRDAAALLGRPMRVVRVPMRAEREIFFSYLNGTRVGDLFLVPSYRKVPPEEEAAVHGLLAASMPGVRLVAIDADAMVELGGAVHCITVGLNLTPRAHAKAPALRKQPRARRRG